MRQVTAIMALQLAESLMRSQRMRRLHFPKRARNARRTTVLSRTTSLSEINAVILSLMLESRIFQAANVYSYNVQNQSPALNPENAAPEYVVHRHTAESKIRLAYASIVSNIEVIIGFGNSAASWRQVVIIAAEPDFLRRNDSILFVVEIVIVCRRDSITL